MTSTIHPDLENAPVFISGGGSGIGAALTEGFLRQKARVAFIGRSDYSGFVDEMEEKTDNRPLFIQCDATDIPALEAAMDEAAARHGGLRVVVNNAANDQRYDIADITPEIWDEMLAVNLKQYFFACRKAMALMENGGSIVNYTSTAYMLHVPRLAPYVAGNAGIMGLTRNMAQELGQRGIRINAIAPGWVMTEKQLEKWASEEDLEARKDQQSIPELMQPADMVGPTLFLASDASRMMTAQVIAVDGGVVFTG